MNTRTLRGAALLGTAVLTAAIAACSKDSVDILRPTPPVSPIFTSYVALGNSITAGYQSGGINDSTQRESYARYLAIQMRTRYAYPAIAGAGCPPPTRGIARVRAVDSTSTFCALRNPASATAALNNTGVPGAAVLDLTTITTARSNFLTTLFLGGKTQVAKALDAQPTFVSVWIGNNDVLDPGVKGIAVFDNDNSAGAVALKTAVSSPGITNFNSFRASFASAANALRGSVTQGVLIGVVNVTQAPILFPVETLLVDPVRRAEFQGAVTAAAGGAARPVTIDANCSGSRALVSFAIVSQLAAQTNDAARVISCVRNQPAAGLGEVFVLDTLEQALFTSTIGQYNAYIKAKADSIGYAYLNADSVLGVLRTNGSVYGAPHLQEATPWGPAVSNDGIHPARAGHQAVARALITVINAKYGTNIPTF
jgi:lysophospholipase L1-like esterase